MKRLFVTLFVGVCLASCGGSTSESEAKKDTTTAELAEDKPKDPILEKGLNLVAQSDCLTCHKIEETLTGPAYRAVADKYKNHTDATIDTLAGKIISGGSGNWGQIPMTPHPQIAKEDAKTMVKYILSLNTK